MNVSFLANFLLQNVDACIDTLVTAGRLPEAAFFARTYKPSRASEVVRLWQADLKQVNPKAAEALADPAEYPNLFPDLELAIAAEAATVRGEVLPAATYPQHEADLSRDLIELVRTVAVCTKRCASGRVELRLTLAAAVQVRKGGAEAVAAADSGASDLTEVHAPEDDGQAEAEDAQTEDEPEDEPEVQSAEVQSPAPAAPESPPAAPESPAAKPEEPPAAPAIAPAVLNGGNVRPLACARRNDERV